jgi:RNA polymerase sigma-B factor
MSISAPGRPGPARGPGTSELQTRYARERRPADRAELVARFAPLARRLASRYATGGMASDDLEQIAMLGLLKAVDRFDPDHGASFVSFATPTVLGELRRSFRDTAWGAHVPRGIKERVTQLSTATEHLSAQKGRPPRPAELAAWLGCDEEEVLEALDAATSLSTLSLDAPSSGRDGEDVPLVRDTIGAEDPGYELVEDRAAISAALPTLTELQRTVVRLRFEEDLKQSDIAHRTGVSQMHVSRVLRAGLQRLSIVAGHYDCDRDEPVRRP